MKDHIRPKVDTRSSDQSILHVTLAGNQTDNSVQNENLDNQIWTQFRKREGASQDEHRPKMAGDLDRELAFLESLSEQTLYLRMQYSTRGVSREEAARLLQLDYQDTLAVAALVGTPPDETIIGVSRYARVPGTDRAECAIVVADAWHGRGIGTELMRSLGTAARHRGIRTLEGSSLGENQRIHGWARRFGFDVRTEPNSGGQVLVTLDLTSMPG